MSITTLSKKTSKKSCKILQTSETPTAMIKELAAVFLTVWAMCDFIVFTFSYCYFLQIIFIFKHLLVIFVAVTTYPNWCYNLPH